MVKYLHKFKADQQLVQAITELQGIFIKRKDLSEYVECERLVSAYAKFYLPTNQAKLDFLISQLGELDLKDLSFIDFGCGPGTYGLRWLEHFPEADCYFFDQSKVMLAQAKLLSNGKGAFVESVADLPKGQVLFFGNCLNEMNESDALLIIEELDPKHILYIEPGTREFFEKSLKLRDAFLGMDFHIQYPCPSSEKCPMQSFENWCHQTIKVTHNDELMRLSQLAMIDRQTLPMTCHIYSKQKVNPVSDRMLRLNKQTKHSFIYDVCTNNKFERVEVSKRGMKKTQIKELLAVSYGDDFAKVKALVSAKNIKSLK